MDGGGDDSASSASNTQSTTGQGQSNGGDGGVSTATLAVAIVVPIVVLLIAFAVVIVLGIRRGWFLRKQDRFAHFQQSGSQGASTYAEGSEGHFDMQEHGKGVNVRTGELHGHDRPHQSGGSAVHQLYGDEGRR